MSDFSIDAKSQDLGHELLIPTGRRGRPSLDAAAVDIAGRLRQRRLQLHLSASTVAEKLGIATTKYSFFEKQFSAQARQQYLHAVARVLATNPQWLLDGAGTASSADTAEQTMPMPQLAPGQLRRQLAEESEAQAQRAKQRRNQLLVPLADLATSLGVPISQLRLRESKLSISIQEAFESAWEDALKVPRGWLRDLNCPTPELAGVARYSLQFDAQSENPSVASEIRAIGSWLARKHQTRRSTSYGDLKPSEQRWADMFAIRYGVLGADESKLQSVGVRFGITRQAVLQIIGKMTERAQSIKPHTPCLDELAKTIESLAPITVTEIDERLRPLLGESLSVVAAARFAREVLGRSVASLTDATFDRITRSAPMAINAQTYDVELLRAVRECTMKMVRGSGAAQVNFVAGAAGALLNRGVTPEQVIKACKVVDGFEWLLESHGWYWLGADWDNRIFNITKKLLASANRRVDIEEIFGAFGRSRRDIYEPGKTRPYWIDAPHSVLVAVLSRVPWLETIQQDDFRLRTPVPVETMLSDTELHLYRLLLRLGGVAAKHTINENLQQTGLVKFMALQVTLDGSPIISKLDMGIYALRGRPISPEAFATAVKEVGGRNGTQVALDPVDDQGFYRLALELSPYNLQRSIMAVPNSLARALPTGDYALEGFDTPVTLTHQTGRGHRFLQLVGKLKARGYQVGDAVVLHINPETMVMRFCASNGGA
jgi:transcriptional regulator with XRE-family HTH domain